MRIKSQGLCLILSSPSGAGKTTIRREILKQCKDLIYSVSYTTRPPRQNEVSGKDYYFLTEQEFQKKIKQNDFLEYAKVHSHFYGTGKEILEYIYQGKDVIMDIDIQGAKAIKAKIPQAVLLFLVPPSWSILVDRLKNRKTDSKQEIEKRLDVAKQEIANYISYDYLLINDEILNVINILKCIITSEKQRISRLEVDLNDFYTS